MKGLRIEIISTEFGVYNGAVFVNDLPVGTIQFHAGLKPKRTAKAVRLLRAAKIPVEFPQWATDKPEKFR